MDIAEIADVLQFLANAGCYGKNLRVIARKSVGAAQAERDPND
jgi:hypothetical protein